MSLDLFRISHGLDIIAEDYSSSVYYLQGTGIPGGDTGVQDEAPVGSVYTDNATGDLYTKITAGTGTDKWSKQASESYVDSQVSVLGNAFNYVTTVEGGDVATPTDLSALPADDKDPGDYYKVTTSGYFTDGTNTFYANANDGLVWNTTGTVDIIDNTNSTVAGTTDFISVTGTTDTGYTVDIDTAFKTRMSDAESDITDLQSFVGAADGETVPTYSSVTQVTQNADLETAIGELDAAIGTDVTSDDIILSTNSVNANIQALSTYVLEQDQITETTGTTSATDTVVGLTAKWIVRVSDATGVTSYEVMAMSDGTDVDHTRYGVLKLGSAIVGLTTAVTTTGTDLTLTISATGTIDISIKRVAAI